MSGGVGVYNVKCEVSVYVYIMPTRVRIIYLLCAIRANSERFKNYDVVIGYKIIWKCNFWITISMFFFLFFFEPIVTTEAHVTAGENDKQITIYYNIPTYNINNIIIVI